MFCEGLNRPRVELNATANSTKNSNDILPAEHSLPADTLWYRNIQLSPADLENCEKHCFKPLIVLGWFDNSKVKEEDC